PRDEGKDIWSLPDGGVLVVGLSYGNLNDHLGLGFPCPRLTEPDNDPCQNALPSSPGQRFVNAVSVIVMRLDAAGDVRWTRRLTEEAFNLDNLALLQSSSDPQSPYLLIRTAINGDVLIGRTFSKEAVIYRLMADGSFLWVTPFDRQLTITDIEPTDDPAPNDG